MGGGLRVESEECRDEGDEEGGLGVESGGMENEEGRDEGHEEEGGIGVGCGGMGNEGGGGEPGEDSSSGGMGNSTTATLSGGPLTRKKRQKLRSLCSVVVVVGWEGRGLALHSSPGSTTKPCVQMLRH